MTIRKWVSTFAGIDLNLRLDNTCRVADRKNDLTCTADYFYFGRYKVRCELLRGDLNKCK